MLQHRTEGADTEICPPDMFIHHLVELVERNIIHRTVLSENRMYKYDAVQCTVFFLYFLHDGHPVDFLRLLEHDRSEEHTSELQSRFDLVCRLLLEKKN